MGFHPGNYKLQFSPIFQKFRGLATISRLSIFYCQLFVLSARVDMVEGICLFKQDCLSVLSAFGLNNSKRHQTLHSVSFGLEEN